MSVPVELQSVTDLAAALRARRVTAEALTTACLARIDADNDRLRAFTLVLRDQALADARQADRELASGQDRGALHGIPISLKDLIDLRGTPTTAASRVREGHVATVDAPIVTRLREAGAIVVGKTNLHEFAFGTTSEDSAFGAVRNPHATDRSAGGSSGGSAASIVAGMSVASVGTDTGGSIRIPAAACGTVGLKPCFGELPIDAITPLNRSFDHVGPLARTVEDAWILYRAMRGDRVGAGEHLSAAQGMRTLRIGLLRPYFMDVLDDELRDRFEESIRKLKTAGAAIEERAIAHAAGIGPIYLHIGLPEAAAYHADTLERMPERYAPNVRIRLELGGYMLAEDYVRAQDGRRVLRDEVNAALQGCDVLALPTLAIPAPPIGANSVRVGDRQESVRNIMLKLTQLFNMTGHPAISLPCGTTAAGLPCGLQLVGPADSTEGLLSVAAAVEAVLRD
jgi:aspartyl-tRNA(Asn)/glutamyl-tRNA(Gln) amidotransferase subunit A